MSPPRRPPRGGRRQPAKSFYTNPFAKTLQQYKATHPAEVKAVAAAKKVPSSKPLTQREKDEAAVTMGKLHLLPTDVAAATPSLFGTKKGEVKRIATHAFAHALPTGPLKPTITTPPTAKEQAATLHQQATWARNVVVPGKTGQKARKHFVASLTPAERAAKLSEQETDYAATKVARDAQTFHAPRSDFGIGANTDKLAAAAHAVAGVTKAVLPTVHRDPFTHQPVLGAPPAAIGAGHIIGDIAHGGAVEAPAIGNFILHQQPLKGAIDTARAGIAVARGDIGAPIANVADAVRSGIHSVTGLGRAATEIGRGDVGGGTRLGLSSAAGAAQAGGLVPPGALGQVGGLPANVLGGLGKVAVGTAASIPGMAAHPIRSVDEAVGFIRGGGDAAIALGFLLQPSISSHDRNRVYSQLFHGFVDDLMNKYGPGVTWKQAVKNGFDQPLIHALDGLAVAAPLAKSASVMRYWKLPGVSFEDAVRLSRDPTRLGEIAPGVEAPRPSRTATIRGKNIDPYQVPLHESQSPLWRGITRNVGDPLARGVEKVAGPRFPLSETKKGLRAQTQLSKQQVRRYAAQAHALMNQVNSYLGKEPEQGVRLFLSHQRPADIPEDVWLKAALKNTQDMLEEGPAQAARKLTPREQQLLRQVKAMRAGVDRLSQERWGRRVEDVYHEQERLHHSLLLNEHHLKGARERLRAVEGPDEAGVYTASIYKLRTDRLALEQQLQKLAPDDPEIPVIRGALHQTTERISALESGRAHSLELGDVAKGTRIQGARDDVRTLENTRSALQEQLDALTVGQAPVESEMRTTLINRMNELPGVSDEEAAHLTNLFDTSARRWGDHFNRDPGEFYSDPTGFGLKEIRMIQEHADAQLPEGVLAQTRTSAIAANANRIDPEGAYPRSDSGRLYYNDEHRGLVETLDQAEVADVAAKRAYPGKANADHPKRVEARDALAKAREDELYARIWYGSRASKGQVPRVAGRRALANRLVAAYKGRVGALPSRGRTPREMEQLMALLDELRIHGESGRMWYEDSARAIMELAGGDKERAAQIAQLVAIYSPQKAVIPNMGEAIKAYNTWLMKRPIDNGQDWQKAAAQRVLDGEGDWDGRKTNNFYRNFLEDIDKARWKKERYLTKAEQRKALADNKIYKGQTELGEVTADMWMARVFGYLRTGVSEGRYDVIESVTKQIAKETGWKPKQVQAAIWTAIKDKSDDVSANVDFADAIGRHHGIVNYETAPGSTYVGPFNDVYKAWDPETQQAFLAATSRPIDQFLQDAGVLHRRSEFGPGIYEGVASPGARLRLVATRAREDPYTVDPTQRDMFNYVAASIGRATLQNSVAWARGFLPTALKHADTMAVSIGRRASDEEALQLHRLLNPEGQPTRVFVVHAGNEGLLLRKDPGLADEVFPNHLPGKRYHESFQGQVETALDQVFPDAPRDLLRSDGELVENDWSTGTEGYDNAIESALGNTGDAEQVLRFRQLADRLASDTAAVRDEFGADSAAAVERHADLAGARSAAARGRAARLEQKSVTPPALLSQTRGQDLYGAVEFLHTPEGQRILHLTQQADVSTLLHELYGHNVREIAAAYPEQWARVEAFVGKPLAEWEPEDHERFARWSERYFADGVAPTPELVPVFQHLKRSYRETYGAMNRIGRPPPPEVKALFDEMFGSYDDPNVFRVANMTTSIPHDMRSVEQHAIFEFTSKQLADLRRRNDARAYSRSIEKLQKDYEKQGEKADAAGGFDNLSEDDQTQMIATRSQLLTMQAEKTMADVDRATGLRRRVEQIEAALANPTGPGYEGALAALGQLTVMRENILKTVFGDKYDPVFENRVDLLADHLVDKGLIEPDFARGTAKYAPHMPLGGKEPRRVDRPAQGLEGGVIGQVDQSLLGLHNKNNLYRWQNGDLSTDPKVIFDVWQNAQAFAFIKEMKDLLFDMGRPLGRDEPIPDNVFLVKKDGTPVPHVQKVASGVASTDEVQDALTALEARDPAKLEEVVTRYVDDTFLKSEDVRASIQAAGAESADAALAARMKLDNVRVIDRHIVEGLFRPLRGGTSTASRAVDWSNTVARWSLIYTNPAYIPTNFIANNFYLLAQQGPLAVANLTRASKMLLNDKEFAIRVAGEGGELPAQAAIARGRGIGQGLRQREERYLRRITAVPDKLPRMAAWVYEARRMGYRTKEDMLRLIDAEPGTALARRRDLVAHRTNEIMVNFDRLSDWERQTVTKVLFIWPWIRGATAWPFYYAKEFPVETAIGANLGQVAEDRRKAMMGNVRSAYRDLFPITKHGQFARTINVGALSPTSTAASSLQAILDLGRINVPSEQGSRVMDFFNPLWQGITQNVTGMNDYGQPISHKDALFDSAVNFVPFGGIIRQVIDPTKASKVYNRRDWKALLERRVGRVLPMEVDLNRLHAFQTQNGKKTTQQRLDDKMASLVKSRNKVGGTMPIPKSVRHALLIQTMYEEEVARQEHDLGQSSDWHPKRPGAQPTLSPLQRARVVYSLYLKTFPTARGVLPPPEQINKSGLDIYSDGLLYGNESEGFPRQDALLGPLQEYRSDLSKEKTGG